MNEKWTKKQIETAKEICKKSCCEINCKECSLYKNDCCIIVQAIRFCTTRLTFVNSKKYEEKFKRLISKHEHDVDDNKCTCKQAIPPHSGTSRVLDYVLKDLQSRAEMGKRKYGHYLETNNGRNALQDAYEEALDMCMYLKQKILEEEGK